eukprot:jgi/Astpho2/1259/fgenesh1_pg.00023_%23_17_t
MDSQRVPALTCSLARRLWEARPCSHTRSVCTSKVASSLSCDPTPHSPECTCSVATLCFRLRSNCRHQRMGGPHAVATCLPCATKLSRGKLAIACKLFSQSASKSPLASAMLPASGYIAAQHEVGRRGATSAASCVWACTSCCLGQLLLAEAHLIASRGHAAPTSHMDDGIAAYWKQISGHGLGATEAAIVAAQVAGGTGAHPKSCTPQLLHKQALTLTSVPAAELPDAVVQQKLSQVFSSALTLSASLAAPDASVQKAAPAPLLKLLTMNLQIDLPTVPVCPLLEPLIAELKEAEASNLGSSADRSLLRTALALLVLPLREEATFEEREDLLLGVVQAIAAWPPAVKELLQAELASWPAERITSLLETVQTMVTMRIIDIGPGQEEQYGVMLQLAYNANCHSHAIEYSRFYLDVINQDKDFSWQDDYEKWRFSRHRSSLHAFSFCSFPFAYDAAHKVDVLHYESASEQRDAFHAALMDSILSGGSRKAHTLIQRARHCTMLHCVVLLPADLIAALGTNLQGLVLLSRVRRPPYLVHDTLLQVQNAAAPHMLKQPLKVKFLGEEGVDEGGLSKELLQLLFHECCAVQFGMFIELESRLLCYNTLCNISALSLAVGLKPHPSVRLGRAGLYPGCALPDEAAQVPSSSSLLAAARWTPNAAACSVQALTNLMDCRKLLGQQPKFDDLKDVHPDIYASLQKLLLMSAAEVDALELKFQGGADLCRSTIWAADRSTLQGASQSLTCGDELQVEQEADFGEGTELVDLQPGGADVAVDTDNRRQYVDLYHKHLLVTSIQPQFDSFARGWRQHPFLTSQLHSEEAGAHYDDGYTADSQGLALGGHCQSLAHLDNLQLQAEPRLEGGHTADSEAGVTGILACWEGADHLRQAGARSHLAGSTCLLLVFATGSDRVPVKGLAQLQPPFTISRAGPHSDPAPTPASTTSCCLTTRPTLDLSVRTEDSAACAICCRQLSLWHEVLDTQCANVVHPRARKNGTPGWRFAVGAQLPISRVDLAPPHLGTDPCLPPAMQLQHAACQVTSILHGHMPGASCPIIGIASASTAFTSKLYAAVKAVACQNCMQLQAWSLTQPYCATHELPKLQQAPGLAPCRPQPCRHKQADHWSQTGVLCSCGCRDMPAECMSKPCQAVLEWRLLVLQHSLLTDLRNPKANPPAGHNVARAEGGTEGVQPLVHLRSIGHRKSGRKESACLEAGTGGHLDSMLVATDGCCLWTGMNVFLQHCWPARAAPVIAGRAGVRHSVNPLHVLSNADCEAGTGIAAGKCIADEQQSHGSSQWGVPAA